MDQGTAIVGFIAVALCALPFVADRISRSRKKNQLLGSLRGMAQQHNCNVDKHGSCGSTALGLDEGKQALFLYGQRAERIVAAHIDLTKIGACRTVKVARSGKGQQSDAPIEQLALSFVPKDKNVKDTQFELYHANMGIYLTDELEFADKWTKLINDRLQVRA